MTTRKTTPAETLLAIVVLVTLTIAIYAIWASPSCEDNPPTACTTGTIYEDNNECGCTSMYGYQETWRP